MKHRVSVSLFTILIVSITLSVHALAQPSDQSILTTLLKQIASYHYGESRKPMIDLDEFIRKISNLPEERQKIINQFQEFLRSDATVDGKQFICSRLALFGSDTSVPLFVSMLTNDLTTDMALSALETMQSAKADEALLQALPSSSGRVTIGILSALSNHRVRKAIPSIRPFLQHQDQSIAAAAISAIGHIGTLVSLELLKEFSQNVKPEMREHLFDAMLITAGHLMNERMKELSHSIYTELSSGEHPLPIRSAALRGMILTDPGIASSLISATLKGKESGLHSAAVQLVRELTDIGQIREIAKTFPDLPAAGQVQLLTAFSHHRDAEVVKTVVGALGSKQAEVRTAALRTLGSNGDASVVPLLAAAATAKGFEQKEARISLVQLNAPGVEEAIVREMTRTTGAVKGELVKAVGERKIISALPLVLQSARDNSMPVRIECIKVLRSLATADQLPPIVELLVLSNNEREEQELQNAIIAIAKRIANPAVRDAAVLAEYLPLKKEVKRASFIKVLGKIGAPASLAPLRSALEEKNFLLRLAAIRALSEWPTAAAFADLWKIATATKEPTAKTLSLRGAVALIGLDANRTGDELTKIYREAMAIAPNKEEQKYLLSLIGQAQSVAAFQLASSYVKDTNLKSEAAVAAVAIGEAIAGTASSDLKAGLTQVIASSASDSVKNRAKKIFKNIERLEDHITDWEYAGPYSKKDASLFKEPFAPEGPDAAAVVWKLFKSMTDSSRLWRLEFDKVFKEDNQVVYIRTNVWSPMEQPARLELGSDEGVKAWLNSAMVHEKEASRTVSPGDDIVMVTLKQGWNVLMMKINNGGGSWGACARFRLPDGKKLDGLRISINTN
ncbi:MAG: HEAT repeat domain-containing protein [bacterium]